MKNLEIISRELDFWTIRLKKNLFEFSESPIISCYRVKSSIIARKFQINSENSRDAQKEFRWEILVFVKRYLRQRFPYERCSRKRQNVFCELLSEQNW